MFLPVFGDGRFSRIGVKFTVQMKKMIRLPLVLSALLGGLAAQNAMGADIRYMNSGDYLNAAGWQGGVIPGTNDTARFNWGNNTVTLSGEAPLLRNFQMGVDESGQLVVDDGGKLTTVGPNNSTVGNNNNAAVVGRLTIHAGGEVNVTNVLFVGASATGILTNDGGVLNISSLLWVGSAAPGVGSIFISNGGVINVGGNIGLGTVNASTASGGKGSVFVQDGGVLNLANISPDTSIQSGSILDISGSGVVTIPGDRTSVMRAYTNAAKITAFGGAGSVAIDFDTTNPGKTTLSAVPGFVPPADVVWNPSATNGFWNVDSNWTGGVRPAAITKVTFNVPGAIPALVTNAALASYIVLGDNGPGGTLILTNGGTLTSGTENASEIGYNSNAVMVVENGTAATFGFQLWIGFDPGAEGTLIMNGGTVSVADMFGLGWNGGKGLARIRGGSLNLSRWDDVLSIQGDSILDISDTGKVVINGNHLTSIQNFISAGQITNHTGVDMVVVDYNTINVGKTTIYPRDLYVAPEQSIWNPALNTEDQNGLWSNSSNWSGGILPGNPTTVLFNVADAIPATLTNAAAVKAVRIGINGPGGALVITNGGSLTALSPDEWSSIGYNNTAQLIVENGGSATFGNHLWVGFDPTADGVLTMNGGTVTVGQMFGLGWNGGKGAANINGGTLNLTQWSASNPGSIAGESTLNLAGSGKVVINGDQTASVGNYVAAGKITANGGTNVFFAYDANANKTTISAQALPPPSQSITAVSVTGGNVLITFETTAQHTYHIEATPTLTPPAWTTVAGSTTNGTGAPVTVTIPAGSGSSMFYRTVSP